MVIATPVVLAKARAAYDGSLMLMKGPEVAAHYLHPSDRVFRDLDLLAADAPAAQRALLDAGFVELDDPRAYDERQHLSPLAWPGIPLVVEVHRHPNVPSWLPPVRVSEILEASTPSETGISGLLAPAHAVHGLLLAAHSWNNHPIGRISDLIDLAAIMTPNERPAAEQLAARWGWERIWRASTAASDAILNDNVRPPRSFGTWARHLPATRDRTVIENHLARVAAPICALPPRSWPRGVTIALRDAAKRGDDERWSRKLWRARLALAHAFMEQSVHDQRLEVEGRGLSQSALRHE